MKELIASCDVLIVVGSITSSNSNRLRELAERAGRPGYLIDDASFLQREWFEGKSAVGVTAGASAPEELVQQVVARLREWGGTLGRPSSRAAKSTWCSPCRAHCAERSTQVLYMPIRAQRSSPAIRAAICPAASTAKRRPFWSMRSSTQRVSATAPSSGTTRAVAE